MANLKTLNNLLKEKGKSNDTEVTRFKGKYYLLHICQNGNPVPLMITKDPLEIQHKIEIR